MMNNIQKYNTLIVGGGIVGAGIEISQFMETNVYSLTKMTLPHNISK